VTFHLENAARNSASRLEIEIPRCVCRQVEEQLERSTSDASSVTFGGLRLQMGEDGKRVMGWG